jgi:hypothetical protein
VDDQIQFSTPTGGWNESIPGPMTTGSGHIAQLLDSQNNIKDAAGNITVL